MISEESIKGALAEVRLASKRPSASYLVGAVFACFLALLLPLLYLGGMGAIGWWIWTHASEGSAGKGRGSLLLYLAPFIVGTVLLIAMVRPFLSRPARQDGRYRLRSGEAPALEALVAGVCRAVGARPPREIVLDCAVNASAGFHDGRIFGRDRVLTIGLPLLGGMRVSELAGVLAHEFGHFSQGLGTRLSFLIQSTLVWFQHAAYQRDNWDQRLDRLTNAMPGWLGLLFLAAQAALWVTRKLLALFFLAGRLGSNFFIRRMEFDADRYETLLVGSSGFRVGSRRVVELSFAESWAQGELTRFWQDDRLPEDWPSLILHHDTRRDAELLEAVDAFIQNQETSLGDTHPPMRVRIAAADQLGAEALFTNDHPARKLVPEFEKISREASSRFYGAVLGKAYKKELLVPLEQVLGESERLDEEQAAMQRYFKGCFSIAVPWPLDAEVPLTAIDPGGTAKLLKKERDGTRAYTEDDFFSIHRFLTLLNLRDLLEGLVRRQRCGGGFDPSNFGLVDLPGDKIRHLLSAVTRELEERRSRVLEINANNARRLDAALSLLQTSPVKERVENVEEHIERVQACWPVLAQILQQAEIIEDIGGDIDAFQLIFGRLAEDEEDEKALRQLRQVESGAQRDLRALAESLGDVPFPFEHGQKDMSLARYVVPGGGRRNPQARGFDPHSMLEAVTCAHQNAQNLAFRCLGILTSAAEAVEKAIGLEPLEAPSLSEEQEQARGAFPSRDPHPAPALRRGTGRPARGTLDAPPVLPTAPPMKDESAASNSEDGSPQYPSIKRSPRSRRR